ncbi:hypothetical protein BH09ACT1_BH09ACT1_21370 [soil metagenome]
MSAVVFHGRSPLSNTGSVVRTPRVPGIGSGKYSVVTEAQLLSLLGLPEYLIGTGSDLAKALANMSYRRASGASGSSIRVGDRPEYIEPGKLTSEIVNSIRTAFGLSITDLAAVLGVERPTIYSWLRDQSIPSAVRMPRMSLVLRLADTWTAKSGAETAPVLSAHTQSGKTLLEALKEPSLWESEILSALNTQAASSGLRSRPSRLSALARERGLENVASAEFDIATNRPFGPED